MRTMQILLDGRWAEAERAALDVLDIGERSGLSLQEYGVAMLVARGEQLRMGELAEEFETFAERFRELPAWHTCLAWAYAQAGRLDAARAELEALRRDDFALLPRDVNFDPGLAMLAHAAAELGDAELAAEIEPHLRPLRRLLGRVRGRLFDARPGGLLARPLRPADRPPRRRRGGLRAGDREEPGDALPPV